MIFACPKRVYSSILPQKQWVGGAHALFRLNRIEQHRSSTFKRWPKGSWPPTVGSGSEWSKIQATISWVTMLQRPLPVSSMLCQSWRACCWQETFLVAWPVVRWLWIKCQWTWFLELPGGLEEISHVIQIVACTYWILFGKSEKWCVCVCATPFKAIARKETWWINHDKLLGYRYFNREHNV